MVISFGKYLTDKTAVHIRVENPTLAPHDTLLLVMDYFALVFLFSYILHFYFLYPFFLPISFTFFLFYSPVHCISVEIPSEDRGFYIYCTYVQSPQ